jgi:oligoribonuclease
MATTDHPNKIKIKNEGKKGLVWIDLEMTGLDTLNDEIIEIATIVTDQDLNILAEGPVFAIKVSDQKLNGMDDWNTKQHGQSGLIDRVRRSTVTLEQAEAETIAFLNKWVDAGKSPMCGNSICQDRRFMARQMPELERFFHYRNLDVSSIKELCFRWRPDILRSFEKNGSHLAMDDIRDSIRELKHYRTHFFKLLEK